MSVASADEKSLSIFQYITRDYPFGSDDVCSVSAFAAAIAPGRIILEQIRFVRNRLWRSDKRMNLLYLIDVDRIHKINPPHEMSWINLDPV